MIWLRRAGGVLLVLAVAWMAALGTSAELAAAGRAPAAGALPPVAGAYLLALGAAGVLPLRTRLPVAVAAAVAVLTYAYRTIGYPGEAPGIALFVTCYAVGAHSRGRRWVAWTAGVTLLSAAVPLLPPHPVPLRGSDAWAVIGPALGLVTMAMLGVSVRVRREEGRERLRLATERAEGEIARRVAAERLGIARELHDVLAHTISVISVQSGVALDVLDDDPQRARRALQEVRASSREAVAELGAAVRALRGEGGVLEAPLTIAALADVALHARAAGLDVELRGDQEDGEVAAPPLVQAAAHRIVQEALTNCIRHSDGRSVRVNVTRPPGALTVEVVDDGTGPAEPTTAGSGLGLVGIRERAEAVGGRAETGWTPRGFRVFAWLPVPPDDQDPTAVPAR